MVRMIFALIALFGAALPAAAQPMRFDPGRSHAPPGNLMMNASIAPIAIAGSQAQEPARSALGDRPADGAGNAPLEYQPANGIIIDAGGGTA